MATEVRSLPDGWEMSPIADVVEKTGTRDPRKQPAATFRYVDVSSVDSTAFRIRSADPIPGKDAPSRARKEIRANDVLFATVRPTLKRVALVPPELDGEIASTGYCVLRPRQELVEPSYLYHCLLTDWFIDEMARLERGASYPAVRDSDVTRTEIPLPPVDEQKRISSALTLVQTAKEQQRRKGAILDELFHVLLHQLLAGDASADHVDVSALAKWTGIA